MALVVLVCLATSAAGLTLRASVFRLERVLERRRLGRTRVPLLALPPLGHAFDVFDPEAYSPEGRRYLPWIAINEILLVAALLWFVFPGRGS